MCQMQEWSLTHCYPFGLSPFNELYRGKLVSSIIANIPYLLALTLSIISSNIILGWPFVPAYHLLQGRGFAIPSNGYFKTCINLSISNDIVSSKIYDDFDFEIVHFPFLNGDVLRSTSLGIYISLSSFDLLEHLAMLLTSTLVINFLNQAIRFINFAKHFLNFIDDTIMISKL